MRADITVQFITAEPCVPAENDILRWAGSALDGKEGEVTIRITDEDEMRSLNNKWRNIDRPTNVLSFPLHDAGGPLLGDTVDAGRGCGEQDSGGPMLGDMVICAPVLSREAAQQGKSLDAHWAHLIIHGILHLMGYDHSHETEAEIMEAKETALLQDLGFPDPYSPVAAICPDKTG